MYGGRRENKGSSVLRESGINALVVIGGEGFLKGAQKLYRLGVKVAGIPCTDDHDLPYTDTQLI
ncbi:6-phosphofructokinase [Bacillus spizizenii]|uniref:6-phosphofructokinase n=1 Tax=Bacillus spizizenii TaxID=96241 RepID=UPI0009B21CB6|nr:6-phosphofructokinase [Bacillus spizizenii]